MKLLDIFSGIGGFSLGLSRAGMTPVCFAEIEPYCRRVLAHHWPGVFCYQDVRDLNVNNFERLTGHDPFSIDVIAGGFPCTGISVAGKGLGFADPRSALWWEYLRIVAEIRPSWVIIENVPALRTRGLDVVLRGIAQIGYDCEWNCVPASALGAPHRRDRVWIVAYPNFRERSARASQPVRRGCGLAEEGAGAGVNSDATGIRRGAGRKGRLTDALEGLFDQTRWNAPNADSAWLPEREGIGSDTRAEFAAFKRNLVEAVWQPEWPHEPALLGVDDGVPQGLDLPLYTLGNAIVPQIAEAIGRAIRVAAPIVSAEAPKGFF